MSILENRSPGQETEYVPVTTTVWGVSSTANWEVWTSQTTTPTETPCTTSSIIPVWTTSTTTPCTTTTTPIWWSSTPCTTTLITTTPCSVCITTLAPAVTTNPSEVVVAQHNNGGLSPGVVGAIVIGVFFGVLLLALICIWCFRAARSRAYYDEDDESEVSRTRPPRPIDPYPGRGMTFVGGGSHPETKVVITRSQRMFVRPPQSRRVETIRRERVVVVEED